MQRNQELFDYLSALSTQIQASPIGLRQGRLKKVSGAVLEVEGLSLKIGEHATVHTDKELGVIDAECVGFDGGVTYLMPFDVVEGLKPGMVVSHLKDPYFINQDLHVVREGLKTLPINNFLLGRVVDGFGRPLDNKGVGHGLSGFSSYVARINPLDRIPITEPLDTGVRAINALLSIGRGQRVGIFSGSGVGKSVLISMLVKNCSADVVVVALIGERSREVREFIDLHLKSESLSRSVVVAATADTTPIARVRGAELAASVAAWFRDQGKNVVFIMDSLTRVAMAQREIGFSLGEPPVARGYPASVLSKIPEVVERVGNGHVENSSLTSFFTVLLAGDDFNDPVGDAARSVLDGHIFLSRQLADSGHYPAIDVNASISRVMPKVVSEDHLEHSISLKRLIAKYSENKEMLLMGAYASGTDVELDEAIKKWPSITKFLRQQENISSNFSDSYDELIEVLK